MSNKLKLVLAILGLLLQLSQDGQAKRWRLKHSRKAENNMTQLTVAFDIGGLVEANLPDWLGLVYAPHARHEDGEMVGSVISITPGYFLMHGSAYNILMRREGPSGEKIGPETEFDEIEASPGTRASMRVWAVYPSEPKLNIYTQPPSKRKLHNPPKLSLDFIYTSPFSLYKFGKGETEGLKPPLIETNKDAHGTDCFAYGWSAKPVKSEKDAHFSPTLKYFAFVKYPIEVNPSKCHKAHCTVKATSRGYPCIGGKGYAAPVLCGPQKKLTYLLSPPPRHCRMDNIQAVFMPYLVEEINGERFDVFP